MSTTTARNEAARLTTFGMIVRSKRLQNSVNGNPRYSITVQRENGQTVTVRTEHDSSLAYRHTFTNLDGRFVLIHYTRSNVLKDITVYDGTQA